MLFGIYGISRAGKDTIADHLVRNHGFERFAFADSLRDVLLKVLEVSNPLTADFVKEKGWDWMKGEAPWLVDAMIALGQGMRDYVDRDVWVRALKYERVGRNVVVSDMRHLNEVERIYTMGGKLWKIERDGTRPRAMDMILSEYSEWDRVFSNNGTLEELYAKVDHAVKAEQESLF